jgi:RNA polymerase sigma-70 factor (ECF subfamily)
VSADLTQDRALLDGFRRGERAALERVYRAHVDEVIRLFRHGFVSGEARVQGLADLDACLDLTQDVFIRAFSPRARAGYDGLRPYGPYLARIAKNLWIDRLRASGREVSLAAAAVDDGPAPEDHIGISEAPEPEVDLDRRRLDEATRAFLATQSEELQTFVRLRFVEERSQYEVLEAMKVTRRRVRTLEKQALSGLRAFLADRGLP